jgi:hypothetical protein
MAEDDSTPQPTYPPERRPIFEEPDPDQRIWRYLTLPKFLDLMLTGRLWFSRADQLGDPFEGSIPLFNKLLREKLSTSENETETRERLNRAARKYTYINCWHMNDQESAGMWSAYTNDVESVAVVTTYDKMRNALPRAYKWGTVKYIDYRTEVSLITVHGGRSCTSGSHSATSKNFASCFRPHL